MIRKKGKDSYQLNIKPYKEWVSLPINFSDIYTTDTNQIKPELSWLFAYIMAWIIYLKGDVHNLPTKLYSKL